MDRQVRHGEPTCHDHGVLAAEGEDVDGDDVPVRDLVGMRRTEPHACQSAKRHDRKDEREEQASVSVHGGPPEGMLGASCVCQLLPRS
jgi:hypothetical protein